MRDALMPHGFEDVWLDTGEVRLHVVRGPRNGRIPLVLIPGQAMSWRSYAKVLRELSRDFEVYVTDVRGHGESGWTPGAYDWNSMGRDCVAILWGVVGRPAIVSGNSSGGIIAGWAAAEAPAAVVGWLPEDPPLFSSEWPRLRDSTYIHRVFELCTQTLDRPEGRDLAAFVRGLEVPGRGRRVSVRMPGWLSAGLGAYLRHRQTSHPGEPIDLPFLPLDTRVFIRGLSEYDPGFTRAFFDGSAALSCNDHAALISRIACPTMLLAADSFMHEEFGLVGAMTQDDVRRFEECVPQATVRHVDSRHIVHIDKPREFVRAARELAARIEA